MSADPAWKKYPFVKIVTAIFGVDYEELIKTNLLFVEALSFSYRFSGNALQRNLALKKIDVGMDEMESLYSRICTHPQSTIDRLLGKCDTQSDLAQALNIPEYMLMLQRMDDATRQLLSQRSNWPMITQWIEKSAKFSERRLFLEYISKARETTRNQKLFHNSQPTLQQIQRSIFLLSSDTSQMCVEGTMTPSTVQKSAKLLTASEVNDRLSENGLPQWGALMEDEEVTGDLFIAMTSDDLFQMGASRPEINKAGRRGKILKMIAVMKAE